MRCLTVLLVLATLVSACATVQTQGPKRQTGSFPDVGKTNTVAVGQVMIAKYDYLAVGTATLLQEIPGGFWSGRKGLSAGAKLLPAISSGQQVFCDQTPREGAPCVRDTDGDARFDRAYTMNGFGVLVNGVDIPPASYRISDQAIQDGFKYELLYEGIDRGVVRIAYREYTENIARPAFSQDLTYTLNANGEAKIRFREVSAVIHRADNNQIEYTVESGF